jgi:membrane-associated PAP2 superfamily phosphatase
VLAARSGVALPAPARIRPPSWESRRRLLRDASWLFVGLVAITAWDASGLDLMVSRLFGDAAGFAWRDHWFVAGVVHENARWVAWGIGLVLLASVWRPLPFARACPRPVRIWWVATTLACVALIPLMKVVSLTSCPWSLAEFGGTAQHVSHWAFGQADGGPGRCFPAGHATAAFCFLAGYFALRDSAPLWARRWLIATLSFGAVLAAVQVMRGAHYVSHSLWTAWWCWAFAFASWHAMRPDRRKATAR